MAVRGIRGAITVDENSKDEISTRTIEMLTYLVEKNNIEIDDIASAVFSVTDDLNADFPAVGARKLGWNFTPLFCSREIPVEGSLKMCVRVLLHVNMDMPQKDVNHAYLRGAEVLRPDINK